MKKRFLQSLVIAATTATLVAACATSPTGRSQLKLYSKNQLADMGTQAFDSMKTEQKVSKTPVENEFVTCVASYITKHVPKEVFDGTWELVVFEDEQVNAFALPGGKIGVYTGLLNVAENQHQLAAVIGHEVGHVIAEHGNERMSNSALIGIGLEATNQILQSNEVGSSNMIMAAIGVGVQVGVQLPFSRTHESEADLIGLDLMARAGFDPRQSVNLWQNMDKASGGNRPLEFMSTHPSPNTRIKDLQANMAKAQQLASSTNDKPNCHK
ncbi:M48 family metallopeptidase [Aliiglaciecola sp. LCG003]|uniref:M48 family metallopeptidase n=1 Tax=Aliiglaciecola sp. LCG003 TaxID=3053655 RepID=UPI0025743933|nr:M48 family metallopeptidase [Aliiglaciecola sp. LCG003]WJG08649.1 M48 family metallopeptidase [Aliiglaciecola sp. LCG003]